MHDVVNPLASNGDVFVDLNVRMERWDEGLMQRKVIIYSALSGMVPRWRPCFV